MKVLFYFPLFVSYVLVMYVARSAVMMKITSHVCVFACLECLVKFYE